MKRRSYVSHTDHALLTLFSNLVAGDRARTVELLEVLGEVDRRRRYLPAVYSSMFGSCVDAHAMPEDVAYKRIRVARAARRWPAILEGIADGRLNLSSVMLVAPHLTSDTAAALLALIERRTNLEIRELLAVRFPQADVPTRVIPLGPVTVQDSGAASPSPVEPLAAPTSERAVRAEPQDLTGPQLAARPVVPSEAPAAGQSTGPLSPTEVPARCERYALQVTLTRETHELLREAQALLGHVVASGDVTGVLDRALRELVSTLRKRRCAASGRPREATRPASANPRHVPAAVRRAVWARDGDRCTFVGSRGHRCGET
jgi:hypothetical protein